MKSKKGVAFFILILIFFINSIPLAFAATNISFKDIKGHWAEEEICSFVSKGFVSGYEDNTFRPDNLITRAEFVALVNRSFGFKDEAKINFRDVKSSDWYYNDIQKGVAAGYISGYENNMMNPDKFITREETASIISRLLKLPQATNYDALNKFKDSNKISDWAKNAVDAVATNGLISGYSDGTFQAQNYITRAETVVILQRSINKETNPVYNNEPSRSLNNSLNKVKPFAGKGIWCSIYTNLPNGADLSRLKSGGVTHIYLEVATSTVGFSDQYKNWIDTLLPTAHRAGIQVIGWIYTDFKDISSDAQLTDKVANYTTPEGYHLDGIAADIEELPETNQAKASKMVEDYANQALKGLPSNMPFVAITYPPQQRPQYPYAAMSRYFNAIALMDYWHTSNINYTYDDTRKFVSDSIKLVKNSATSGVNIEVVLQGCVLCDGLPLPSASEMKGALDGAVNADGYSVYTWETLNEELRDIFVKY
ncbi:MAG: S-layer homology domain-containing protein [Thermoanaerobacteraceae bacterium]|nr:S-layer homology domain-containing protein [Thermoanaerobacteraceae bacterium]